jgi:HEAT repeat protein
MISVRLLDVAIAAIAALLLLALALLVGHGIGVRAVQAARRRRVAAARDALRAAAGRAGDDEERARETATAALRELPDRHAVALLSELAPSLAGPERAALGAVARERGLLAAAESACSDRRWRRRLHAVRILALLGGGEDAVPPLLGDPRPEVRAQAAEWVLGEPRPEHVERLVAMLSDPERFSRFTVMDTLIRLGARAVEPLAAAIAAGGGAEALTVAARIGDPRLSEAAAGRIADPDPQVRAWAVRMLGALGGDRHATEVQERLEDHAPEVRAAAAVALGRLGHWPAAPALGLRLRDRAWQVRRDASLALRALGPPGELLLERALRDEDPFARDMARQTLDLPEAVLPA